MTFLMTSPGCCCEGGTECAVCATAPSAWCVTFTGWGRPGVDTCDDCDALNDSFLIPFGAGGDPGAFDGMGSPSCLSIGPPSCQWYMPGPDTGGPASCATELHVFLVNCAAGLLLRVVVLHGPFDFTVYDKLFTGNEPCEGLLCESGFTRVNSGSSCSPLNVRVKVTSEECADCFEATGAFGAAATISAFGTFVDPVYTATANLRSAAVFTATGTFTTTTYTGTAALRAAATLSGSGTFVKPTYTGSASLRAAAVLSGVGTVTQPTYTGTAALRAAAILSGTGITECQLSLCCLPAFPTSLTVVIAGITDSGSETTFEECCDDIDGTYPLTFVSGHLYRYTESSFCSGLDLTVEGEIRFDVLEEECVLEVTVTVKNGASTVLETMFQYPYTCGENCNSWNDLALTFGTYETPGTDMECADPGSASFEVTSTP